MVTFPTGLSLGNRTRWLQRVSIELDWFGTALYIVITGSEVPYAKLSALICDDVSHRPSLRHIVFPHVDFGARN
jgi:hypothetical protein